MGDIEFDLILMSLVIFVPTIFAIGLMVPWVFPRGREDWMRWWALLGTAITLVLSICLFISYYSDVIERHIANPEATLLDARAANADVGALRHNPPYGTDWLTRLPWISHFNIDYYLGVDGISMPLILLTTALCFLAMIASWKIERFVRGYCILFLLLETGMVGTFFALDFFLFYIFWELMLLPMYFLIGVWGGPRREYAAIKFFLYTLLGSVFILIALVAFFFTDIRDFSPRADPNENLNSFDLVALHRAGEAAARLQHGEAPEKVAEYVLTSMANMRLDAVSREKLEYGTPQERESVLQAIQADVQPRLKGTAERLTQPFFTSTFQMIMFLLLFVGFAIKVPLFPFHTWLPDAHVEAPTPISMILAGVLLKMGGYGILRIAYPICPWAAEAAAWWLALFGVINIVYGAFAAMAQTDFKKLVAYSSISHMGYVILGIAVWSATGQKNWAWSVGGKESWWWAMNGAMFQMIAHGISSAGMFFLVGVIYDRAHHRNLDNFRGLFEPMPLYGGISAIIFFAAMGLPGMCGFVGEFMVVLGTWNYSAVFAILAALTVVLTAAYILWTLQRVYLGVNPAYKDFPDISFRELLCAVPLVIAAIALGVYPSMLLSWMSPSVTGLVNSLARLTGQ